MSRYEKNLQNLVRISKNKNGIYESGDKTFISEQDNFCAIIYKNQNKYFGCF